MDYKIGELVHSFSYPLDGIEGRVEFVAYDYIVVRKNDINSTPVLLDTHDCIYILRGGIDYDEDYI